MIADAVAAGADVYVTGDVKYHDFTTFCDRISIADIGHYESEQCAKEIFGRCDSQPSAGSGSVFCRIG